EAAPSVLVRVTDIPVRSGRRLRTVRGMLAELDARAASLGEDYLRVFVREPARAGLRDDAVAILPNALDVRIDPEFAAPSRQRVVDPGRATRTPAHLFAQYCQSNKVSDDRLTALVCGLHDEVTPVNPE